MCQNRTEEPAGCRDLKALPHQPDYRDTSFTIVRSGWLAHDNRETDSWQKRRGAAELDCFRALALEFQMLWQEIPKR